MSAQPSFHRSFFLDEALYDYGHAHTTPADEVRRSLTTATAALGPGARLLVSDYEASLL